MAWHNAFLLMSLAALAHGQETVLLQGIVTGPSGSPLTNVRVDVADSSGRTVSKTRTDNTGRWSLKVPAGRYRLSFEARGFDDKRLDALEAPGEPATIVLAARENKDEGAVVYRPVVDPERTQQSDFITTRELMNLPVNRRNYLNLAALTPGVLEINDYVGVTDAPLVQAPQSGLSFGGNNGRGNVFWLDGGENYLNTGGVRPSISQEAVAEFQVTRSNYSAEFGGGIGGIVNIISKSGSNDIHGDLFGFLRHRSVQARNYFHPVKGAFTRTQTGGTLEAPLRKDRTFVFFGFERLGRQESGFVPLGREDRGPFSRLRRTQQELADFFKSTNIPDLVRLGFTTEQLLLTTNFPDTLAFFGANRGVFPFSESNVQGSMRIDHRFSDNHNAFLRFNAATGHSENSQVEGLTGFSRGLVSDFSDQTLMVNDTFVISEKLVSESRFSLNRTRFNIGNRDRLGPGIEVNGYGLFGKDWTLPSDYGEWHGQLQQNFFYTPGRHSIRFGADINPVRASAIVQTNLGGRFNFGEYLPLGGLYNFLAGDPNAADRLAGTLAMLGRPRLIPNLAIPLTAIQAFNLGIPGFYVQGFGNPSWQDWFPAYNFFFNDVMRLHPRLTLNAGVRYELQVAPESLGTDPNNIAPRIGLAWDVTGDRKTVMRAGYGLFYLRHQSQLAAGTEIQSGKTYHQVFIPLSGLPGSRNPLTGGPVTSADIYLALKARGVIGTRAIEAADLAPFGIVPGPDFPYQVAFQRPVNFVNAYAQQTSFDIERAFGQLAVSLGYNFNRAAHLPRLRDLNIAYGPPGADGLPTLVPRDPLVAQRLVFESEANSFYHALFVQATRRWARRVWMNAHYTFSKSIDETTDIHFLPNDSMNARNERGLSTFDRRHRFVGSAIVDLPVRTTFSPIVTAASGQPFNVVTGEDFNSRRPTGAGRNIGRGPNYFSVDARITHRIPLKGERTVLELIAEGFNLLNRTNFRRLNNTVGQVHVDELPRPLVGQRAEVEDPLSFVSAFDPRQIQFALRLRW